MQEENFLLKDGRNLCFALYGPVTGTPIFYFHGTPSSRLEPSLLHIYGVDIGSILLASGTRLIAVDRPGMGRSDLNPKGGFLSFADDVVQLSDHLGIERAKVMSWSGGGPYSLALVHQYPERFTSCHIICGFTRRFDQSIEMLMGMNKWHFILARRVPALLRTSMNLLGKKKMKRSIPQWITGLPYVDYQLIRDPDHLEALSLATMKESVRNGAKGAVYEARGYYRDPGFRLCDIRVPVHYWWGTSDMSVIRLHAEAVEEQVPGAVMHYRQNEGHLSLYVNAFKDVMSVISGMPD